MRYLTKVLAAAIFLGAAGAAVAQDTKVAIGI